MHPPTTALRTRVPRSCAQVLLATEQLEEPLLRNLLGVLIDATDPKRSPPLHMQVLLQPSLHRHRLPPTPSLSAA